MEKEHYFIKEIREQPDVIKKSLEHADTTLKELANRYVSRVDRVLFVGCGDPYMLGIAATYAFERWANLGGID